MTWMIRVLALALFVAPLAAPSPTLAQKKAKAGKAKAGKKGAKDKAPAAAPDEARSVADAYLEAIAGKGDAAARGHLLGGVTFTAQDAMIGDFSIAGAEEPQTEEKYLATAVKAQQDLDKAGSQALFARLEGKLPKPEVTKLFKAAIDARRAMEKDYPIFAEANRADKAIYWHPRNPFRSMLRNIPHAGKYHLTLRKFTVEEKQSDGSARQWTLRLIRFKTESFDSGWKVLPASSWDPDF